MPGPLALVGGSPFHADTAVEAELAEAAGDGEVLVLPTGAAYEHPQRLVDAAVERFGGLGVTARGLDVLRRGARPDVLLVAVGSLVPMCLAAAERAADHGIEVTVVDPRWVLPVAPALVDLAAGYRLVVTVEDGGRAGGVGTTLTQALQDRGCDVPVRTVGLPQAFLEHGSRGQVLADVGLTEQDIARRIAEMPRLGLALTKKAVNQAEDLMGLHAGMDSVFGLHHVAHAHNAEVGTDSLAGHDARSMRDSASRAAGSSVAGSGAAAGANGSQGGAAAGPERSA